MKYLVSMSAVAFLVLPLSAVAAQELDPVVEEIVGLWKLEFTTPDDVDREPIIAIGRMYDKLVAWYVAEGSLEAFEKPEPFKGVRLTDEALLMTITPPQEPGVTVTFKAEPGDEEGTCRGTATYESSDGETGAWGFKGAKVAMSVWDEVQVWTISFVSPDDSEKHEAEVTAVGLGDKVYAWFSSKAFELPATDCTLDGDQATLTLVAETLDGTPVKVTFGGTVDGDSIKGEAEYDADGDTGTFAFSGSLKSVKRKSE